ncbi:MAG: hypothetical protein AAF429_03975 [Pseudomonadota bacterium]
MVVITIGIFIAAGAIAAGAAVFIFFTVNLTGWLPILICAANATYAIGFEYGFVGGWAQLALIIYWIEAIGLLYLLFTKPDPDGLPEGWKFIGRFYTYEPSKNAEASFAMAEPSWSAKGFGRYIKAGAPEWGFNKVLNARQMQQTARDARAEAARLKRENDQRAEELEAAKEMADAMLELEREKARAQKYGEKK